MRQPSSRRSKSSAGNPRERRRRVERARIGAHRRDRLEPAASGAIVERVEDEMGEPVPQGQRSVTVGGGAGPRAAMRRADLLQVVQVVVGPVREQLRDREAAVLRVSPVLRFCVVLNRPT